MKKLLTTLFGVCLLTASADAATVYFDNSATNWANVYTWNFDGSAMPFAGETEKVTIDGHELYKAETNEPSIIFKATPGEQWGQGQTSNITVADNEVWSGNNGNLGTKLVANIVDGKYVAVGGGDEPDPDPNTPPTLYILGSFTGDWTPQNDYKFTYNDETKIYTLEHVTIEAGGSFKVAPDGWAQKYTFGGTTEGNNEDPSTLIGIFPGQSYTLYARSEFEGETDNKNLFVRSDIINATVTFNLETKELTISENGEGEIVKQPWWCAWDIDGSWTKDGVFGHEMEKQEEGTYKIHINCSSTTQQQNYFAVFNGSSATGWGDKNSIRYQPKNVNGNQEVTEDKTYDMMQGSSNTWIIANGDWTVVVDPRDVLNMTISFDYGDSTGEANILIDDEDDGEHSYKSYAMTEVEGDDVDYAWSGTLKDTDYVKFNVHGVNYYYDPSVTVSTEDNHDDHTLTIVYNLIEDTADGNGYVNFAYTSNVEYVVNVTKKTVTLTITNPATVAVTITEGEQSVTHALTQKGPNQWVDEQHSFTLKKSVSQVDIRIHDKRYYPQFPEVSTQAEGATNFTLVELPDADPAPAWNGPEGALYLSVDTESLTGAVASDINTAVATIEAADAEEVYFNLQGIRVANPENGIFIVRKGAKTMKVVK